MSSRDFFNGLAAFTAPRPHANMVHTAAEFQQLRFAATGGNFAIWREDLIARRAEHLLTTESVKASEDPERLREYGRAVNAALDRFLKSMVYTSTPDIARPGVVLYYSRVATELEAPVLMVVVSAYLEGRLIVSLSGQTSDVETMRKIIEGLIVKTPEELAVYMNEPVPE